MKVTCSVKSVDLSAAKMKIPLARTRALTMVTEKAIVHSDPFVPRRDGHLAGSTGRQSRPSLGKIVYDEPYARAQYYGLPNKSIDRHPQAVMQWFEAAKRIYARTWRGIAALEYKRYFGKG